MAPNGNNENPNQFLKIPEWINQDYFKDIIQKDNPNFSKILKFCPIAATPPGENYTSIMVRVCIEYETKDGQLAETSYILKTTLPATNSGSALIDIFNLFPKEKIMYETLIPAFEKLYQDAGVTVKLGPKCLQVEETKERTTIVLEDLKRRNFQNADRLKGFDMPHMCHVLQKLAQLHAVSAKYEEVNGAFSEVFLKPLYNETSRGIFAKIAESKRRIFTKGMRTWNLDNVDKYIAKIPEFNKGFDEYIRLFTVDPNDFNVLRHGDLWVNNIMFNYTESGEINENIFIDFQVASWGSPVVDLWYVITTSASLDIKIKEFDHFVSIYHEELIKSLKLLKYDKPMPTLKYLQIMMLKYSYCGFSIAYNIMPVVLLPSDKDANIDVLLKDNEDADEVRWKSFTNRYYSKSMSQLFPFLDNKGAFDL